VADDAAIVSRRRPLAGQDYRRPRANRRDRLLRGNVRRLAIYLPLILWGAITLYPFAFVLLVSFKSLADIYLKPFGLPTSWHFENYSEAWQVGRVPRLALNSLQVAAGSTLLVLVLAAPAAYALSRFRFRLRPVIWAYLMVGLFVPGLTTIVPLVIITRDLHLYDSLAGLALVYTAGGTPFTVFLLASFMKSLPLEVEEAARVDGAGIFRVLRDVVLPLSRPALITAATFQFLFCWNEFIVARLLLDTNVTLPVGMAQIVGQFGANFPSFAAATVMALIPAFMVFVLLQRHVVRGLAEGAVRG
jgi:raffinose/stachyose/melibiose transport system permease protein